MIDVLSFPTKEEERKQLIFCRQAGSDGERECVGENKIRIRAEDDSTLGIQCQDRDSGTSYNPPCN